MVHYKHTSTLNSDNLCRLQQRQGFLLLSSIYVFHRSGGRQIAQLGTLASNLTLL